jgi:hypothetical protein
MRAWLSSWSLWRMPSQWILRRRVRRRARRGGSPASRGSARPVPSSLQRLSMLAGLLTELNIKPFRLTGSPALAGLSFWCAEAKSPRLNQRTLPAWEGFRAVAPDRLELSGGIAIVLAKRRPRFSAE